MENNEKLCVKTLNKVLARVKDSMPKISNDDYLRGMSTMGIVITCAIQGMLINEFEEVPEFANKEQSD